MASAQWSSQLEAHEGRTLPCPGQGKDSNVEVQQIMWAGETTSAGPERGEINGTGTFKIMCVKKWLVACWGLAAPAVL